MSLEQLCFSQKEVNIICQTLETEEVQIVKILLKSAFHQNHDVSPTSTTHKVYAFCKKNTFEPIPNSSKLTLWDCRMGRQLSVFDELGNPERHYVTSLE